MPKITLDLESLTLRELAEAERQSGTDGQVLLKGKVSQMMLAVFVHRWRTSGLAPSWNEIADLKLLDSLSLISGSQQAEASPTSKA